MPTELELEILPQPDDFTCGPTCLHAVYRYFGDQVELDDVIFGIQRLENQGTLAVYLASHALKRGYRATIYTYNLQLFDPTWFQTPDVDIAAKLRAQAEHVPKVRVREGSQAYLEFLELGGKLVFKDLTSKLVADLLRTGTPVLTGLSATYLYRTAREFGPSDEYDDIRGKPSGHFVVLCGYRPSTRKITIADPMFPNPRFPALKYDISIDRVLCSVLLGILTYDANLLVIEPGPEQSRLVAKARQKNAAPESGKPSTRSRAGRAPSGPGPSAETIRRKNPSKRKSARAAPRASARASTGPRAGARSRKATS